VSDFKLIFDKLAYKPLITGKRAEAVFPDLLKTREEINSKV